MPMLVFLGGDLALEGNEAIIRSIVPKVLLKTSDFIALWTR